MKSIRKIFRSEFLTQFSAGKILTIIISIMIPITVLLLRDKIVVTEKDLKEAKGLLSTREIIRLRSDIILSGPLLGQGITYILLTRIIFIFKDKNTLDKNRLSFLKYNKHLVSFTKVFVDVLLFFLHLCLLTLLGIIVIIHDLKGSFSMQYYYDLFKILTSLTVFYIFTTYGVKLIDSFIKNNFYKKIFLGLWLLVTVGYYLICAIVLRDGTFAAFYRDNAEWIIFVPFLHLLNPAIILYDVYIFDWVELIPMLTLTMLFISITWSTFARSFKENLCA